MVSATPDIVLRPGLAVAIHGLKGAPELNGKGGTVEQWDADKGRWTVRLPGGGLKALKPENLQPKKNSAMDVLLDPLKQINPFVLGPVCLLIGAVFLQQSGAFDQIGVTSPAEYAKGLFEEFEAPPPKAPNKDTVVISFCQGCGTNGLYNQIAELIETRADKELRVHPVNHPVSPLNTLLSQLVMGVQFALMGAVFMDHSLVPDGVKENKMASCVGIFFVGNMLSSGFTKTNAFEIYLDERLLWSTLKMQRKPTMEDLMKSFQKAGIGIQG